MVEMRWTVKNLPTRDDMGRVAAEDLGALVQELQKKQEWVNMIFAAAPSQLDFLKCFVEDKRVDFTHIRAFHMDEYIGLKQDAPQGFANFLKRHLFELAPFGEVYTLDSTNEPNNECTRYTELLKTYPVDIVVMGIGENGHIAFNDPHEADFNDPAMVKIVSLDEMCRQQQVNDKCFDAIEEVPTHALTLTCPTLANAKYHFCIVPTKLKAQAVYNTVCGPVTHDCPATVLRLCKHANLYLDNDSASMLPKAFG